MPRPSETRCLYCNGKLPLLQRLKNSQFCSTAHEQTYRKEQQDLAVERLHQTHDSLRAYKPPTDVESILGPLSSAQAPAAPPVASLKSAPPVASLKPAQPAAPQASAPKPGAGSGNFDPDEPTDFRPSWSSMSGANVYGEEEDGAKAAPQTSYRAPSKPSMPAVSSSSASSGESGLSELDQFLRDTEALDKFSSKDLDIDDLTPEALARGPQTSRPSIFNRPTLSGLGASGGRTSSGSGLGGKDTGESSSISSDDLFDRLGVGNPAPPPAEPAAPLARFSEPEPKPEATETDSLLDRLNFAETSSQASSIEAASNDTHAADVHAAEELKAEAEQEPVESIWRTSPEAEAEPEYPSIWKSDADRPPVSQPNTELDSEEMDVSSEEQISEPVLNREPEPETEPVILWDQDQEPEPEPEEVLEPVFAAVSRPEISAEQQPAEVSPFDQLAELELLGLIAQNYDAPVVGSSQPAFRNIEPEFAAFGTKASVAGRDLKLVHARPLQPRLSLPVYEEKLQAEQIQWEETMTRSGERGCFRRRPYQLAIEPIESFRLEGRTPAWSDQLAAGTVLHQPDQVAPRSLPEPGSALFALPVELAAQTPQQAGVASEPDSTGLVSEDLAASATPLQNLPQLSAFTLWTPPAVSEPAPGEIEAEEEIAPAVEKPRKAASGIWIAEDIFGPSAESAPQSSVEEAATTEPSQDRLAPEPETKTADPEMVPALAMTDIVARSGKAYLRGEIVAEWSAGLAPELFGLAGALEAYELAAADLVAHEFAAKPADVPVVLQGAVSPAKLAASRLALPEHQSGTVAVASEAVAVSEDLPGEDLPAESWPVQDPSGAAGSVPGVPPPSYLARLAEPNAAAPPATASFSNVAPLTAGAGYPVLRRGFGLPPTAIAARSLHNISEMLFELDWESRIHLAAPAPESAGSRIPVLMEQPPQEILFPKVRLEPHRLDRENPTGPGSQPPKSGGDTREKEKSKFGGVRGFWSHAPRDLKLLLFAIPVLLALVFHPSLPKISVSAPESAGGFSSQFGDMFSSSLASFKTAIGERAAVALEEDFRQGLDQWISRGGATTQWSFDQTGFVQPGPLALYGPSMGLVDYQMQFLGLIDQQALSWVVRAEDFRNYYVVKLMVRRGGPLPKIFVTRYAVIDGVAVDRVDTPVPIDARADTIYRVRMDVQGDNFILAVQEQIVDSWQEPRLERGGIGFYTGRGEASRVRWVQLTHQYDMLGRLCAYLAPYDVSTPAGY